MGRLMKIGLVVLIGLLLIALALRLLTLNTILYDDGGSIPTALKYHDSIYQNIVVVPHGISDILVFVIGAKIFGITTVGIRATLFVMSLLYLSAFFFFVNRIFGRNIAVYGILINLFSFFGFYNQYIIDTDGVIQSFFALFVFFPLYLFLSNKNIKQYNWLILSIISYAILISIKHRTGIIIIPISVYIYFFTKNIKKTALISFYYLTAALLVIVGTILVFYTIYGKSAFALLQLIFTHSAVKFELWSKLLNLQNYAPTIIGLTPLFFLPILLLRIKLDRHIREKVWILYCWLFIFFIYFSLVPRNFFFIKYISFLLPPLSILVAIILFKQALSSKLKAIILSGTVVLSSIIIYLNNTIATDYWFFETEMGPVIKIWQPIIYVTFLASCIILLYLIFVHNINRKKYLFSTFMILALSFNILMITDNIVDRTDQRLIAVMQDYAVNNTDLGVIYSWNEDVPFYMGNTGFYTVSEEEKSFDIENDRTKCLREYSRSTGLGEHGYVDLNLNLDKIKEIMIRKGGTVVLLNYPYKYVLSEYSNDTIEKVRLIDKLCNKQKEVVEKTANLVIYKCKPHKININ